MARHDYSGGFFCWNCGEKVQKGVRTCPRCGAKYTGEGRYGGAPALGAGGVGWSDQANHPFFRKYAGKYTKLSVIWMIGLSILIPAVLLISGQVEPEGEGLLVLIAVPAVIWLIGIIFLLKKFGGRNKSWDGVIENKTEEKKVRTEKEGNQNTRRVQYMEYVITIRRQDGGTKRIVDTDNASNYLYFNIGDHVRVHDTKYLKYIEKYDKSRDPELFCAACGSFNDARDNFCERCGAPMLKGRADIPSTYAAAPVRQQERQERPAYCQSCGAPLTGGAFCESCGAKVE